ncbi:TPA: GDSL-type esterase/lipase family protein, partial [Vibrio cholerae O1]
MLFLGDSITYGGHYVTYVEAHLRLHGLEAGVEAIDAGLSSETVSGLSEEGHADGKFPRPCLRERLARVLSMVRPDLVFACYGMNDGIYLPLDEGRFAAYREGMAWLERVVRAFGARAIFLTPPPYDGQAKGNEAYTAVLAHYATWLLG